MLALSTLSDLLAGNLSDQKAYEYLLAISKETETAAALNDLISCIIETQPIDQAQLMQKELSGTGAGLLDSIDCCGTGGSGIPHFNTSTASAFVLAAGGLKVAKFGNRKASGLSGSFDFLDCLGFPIVTAVETLLEILHSTNLCFPFAPSFYPGLAKLAPIRKALGKPTLFNLAGPLLNPFKPSYRVLGTATSNGQEIIADYLFSYKACKKALVVRAESGLDELDPESRNKIMAIGSSGINTSYLEYGLKSESPSKQVLPDDQILTAEQNARLFHDIITNSLPVTNYFAKSISLNAGAGFFVAGKASTIEEGQKLAETLLSSGVVLAKYKECRSIYAKYA